VPAIAAARHRQRTRLIGTPPTRPFLDGLLDRLYHDERHASDEESGKHGFDATQDSQWLLSPAAPSLKVGTRGSRVVIYSNRSGAGVIHWGGRHPLFGNRDRWFAQKGDEAIPRAAVKFVVRTERDVARVVERTMRSAGFH
jgi:hypothetical protein